MKRKWIALLVAAIAFGGLLALALTRVNFSGTDRLTVESLSGYWYNQKNNYILSFEDGGRITLGVMNSEKLLDATVTSSRVKGKKLMLKVDQRSIIDYGKFKDEKETYSISLVEPKSEYDSKTISMKIGDNEAVEFAYLAASWEAIEKLMNTIAHDEDHTE